METTRWELCGNKTLKAVQRCSAAAYGLKECCTQYDYECGIHPCRVNQAHSYLYLARCQSNVNYRATGSTFSVPKNLCRTLHSFPNVTKSPLDQLDVALLNTWLTNHKRKLFSGVHDCNEEDNDEENELNDGHENTPEEDDLDD